MKMNYQFHKVHNWISPNSELDAFQIIDIILTRLISKHSKVKATLSIVITYFDVY